MFKSQFDDKLESCWRFIFLQYTINEVFRWHTRYLLKSFFFILHQKLKTFFHATKTNMKFYSRVFLKSFWVNLKKVTFEVACSTAHLSWNLNTLKEEKLSRKRGNLNGSWDTVASRAMFLFNLDISIYQETLFIVSEGPRTCFTCYAKQGYIIDRFGWSMLLSCIHDTQEIFFFIKKFTFF